MFILGPEFCNLLSIPSSLKAILICHNMFETNSVTNLTSNSSEVGLVCEFNNRLLPFFGCHMGSCFNNSKATLGQQMMSGFFKFHMVEKLLQTLAFIAGIWPMESLQQHSCPLSCGVQISMMGLAQFVINSPHVGEF